MRVMPKRQAREATAANAGQVATAGSGARMHAHSAAFAPFAMEAAALKTISDRVQAAVKVCLHASLCTRKQGLL